MAHFAELDENNKVLRVCVVDDAHVPSECEVDGVCFIGKCFFM